MVLTETHLSPEMFVFEEIPPEHIPHYLALLSEGQIPTAELIKERIMTTNCIDTTTIVTDVAYGGDQTGISAAPALTLISNPLAGDDAGASSYEAPTPTTAAPVVIANAAWAPVARPSYAEPIPYKAGLETTVQTQAYVYEGERYIRHKTVEPFVTSGNFGKERNEGKWYKIGAATPKAAGANGTVLAPAKPAAFNEPVQYVAGLDTADHTQPVDAPDGNRYVRERKVPAFIASGDFEAELAAGKWFKIRGPKPVKAEVIMVPKAKTLTGAPASSEALQKLAERANNTNLAKLVSPVKTASLLQAAAAGSGHKAKLAGLVAASTGNDEWREDTLNIWTRSAQPVGQLLDVSADNNVGLDLGLDKDGNPISGGTFRTVKGLELWLRLKDQSFEAMVQTLRTASSGKLHHVVKDHPEHFNDLSPEIIALIGAVLWDHLLKTEHVAHRAELARAGQIVSKYMHGEEIDEATGAVLTPGSWRHTTEAWWIVPLAQAMQDALLTADAEGRDASEVAVDWDGTAKQAFEDNKKRIERRQAQRVDFNAPARRSSFITDYRDPPKPKHGKKVKVETAAPAKKGKK